MLKHCCSHLIEKKSVVRRLDNLGLNVKLPFRMKNQEAIYDKGSIFRIVFDSSPQTMLSLKKELSYSPDILRSTIIKLGDLSNISNYVPSDKLGQFSSLNIK